MHAATAEALEHAKQIAHDFTQHVPPSARAGYIAHANQTFARLEAAVAAYAPAEEPKTAPKKTK